MFTKWKPPKDCKRISTIDLHAGGEPLRIIVDGLPKIQGQTILEKSEFVRKNLDFVRTALIGEPRGHADMYGCIITEPTSKDSLFGVIFLHNEGYSSMCGHGIIALGAMCSETGQVDQSGTAVDTPAGKVILYVKEQRNGTAFVSFHNVPSFVVSMDKTIEVEGLGTITYDLAFGGAFYAICQAESLGFRLVPDEYFRLIDSGIRIKEAISRKDPVSHPFERDLSFLYGTIFTGPPLQSQNHSRNVCVFANGEVDRSPTGTGVSARAALHFARNEISIGKTFRVESIIGTIFTGSVFEPTRFGPFDAVIPEVSGSAYITGRHEFILDPRDPLKNGFFLR